MNSWPILSLFSRWQYKLIGQESILWKISTIEGVGANMFDLTLFYPLQSLEFNLSLVVKSVLLSVLILAPFVVASYLVNSYIKKNKERHANKSEDGF